MWYPEEPVSYCRHCEVEIPVTLFWRGRGYLISSDGTEKRTVVLYSRCPECGRRLSVGLDGPAWYRALYAWLWRLRYPQSRPPAGGPEPGQEPDEEHSREDPPEPRRRRAGGDRRH